MSASVLRRPSKKPQTWRKVVLAITLGLAALAFWNHKGQTTPTPIKAAPNQNPAPPNPADNPGGIAQPDSILGKVLREMLVQYHPDQSAILLVDGASNRILAWGETQNAQYSDAKAKMILDSKLPIASLSKMVTAAAAFEVKHLNAESPLPMRGVYHTLYKQQLVDQAAPLMIPIKQAFAHSANSCFGILGYRVGGAQLKSIAQKLGFNQILPGLSEPGIFNPPDTGYRLAEVSSGFFEGNTSSPLHISALVRALLYHTPIQLPFNEKLDPKLGLPRQRPAWIGPVLSKSTYEQMLPTFEQTILDGTVTKNIRKYLKAAYSQRLLIGAKTGSLGNGSPESPRYEWFAGFAVDRHDPKKALIFTLVQVHEKIRSLPATAVGSLLINHWADQNLTP